MIINSISYTRPSGQNVIPQSNVEHNSSDTYYFDYYDYNPFYWKDLSVNKTNVSLFNTPYDEADKSFTFSGDNYGYISNSDFHLTNFEESLYFEYSTTFTNNSIIYDGSNKEKIAFGIYNGYIIVSNKDSVMVYSLPSNYADGNKHSFLLSYKDGTRKLYYDGEAVPIGSRRDYWGNINENSYIGRNNSADYFYKGKLYALRIYDKEITPEELDNTENLVLNLDGNDAVIPDNVLVNNNPGVAYSTAHSYIAYDLTNVNEDKFLYVSATIDIYDTGYVQVTDSPSIPSNTGESSII